ncbi:hypothetical protein PENSPDRAFT_271995 [Peniophora sp. CONT]|nr:hypothetical protein PENSPDRAFT_271995 [Peniophora sp. CONT]
MCPCHLVRLQVGGRAVRDLLDHVTPPTPKSRPVRSARIIFCTSLHRAASIHTGTRNLALGSRATALPQPSFLCSRSLAAGSATVARSSMRLSITRLKLKLLLNRRQSLVFISGFNVCISVLAYWPCLYALSSC